MAVPFNDVKLKALRVQLSLSTGTIHELDLRYAQSLGATSNITINAWAQVFNINGIAPGPQPQRWYQFLAQEGFTRFTINEREFDYWHSLTTLVPTEQDCRVTSEGDARVTADGDLRCLGFELVVPDHARITDDGEARLTADGDFRVHAPDDTNNRITSDGDTRFTSDGDTRVQI